MTSEQEAEIRRIAGQRERTVRDIVRPCIDELNAMNYGFLAIAIDNATSRYIKDHIEYRPAARDEWEARELDAPVASGTCRDCGHAKTQHGIDPKGNSTRCRVMVGPISVCYCLAYVDGEGEA